VPVPGQLDGLSQAAANSVLVTLGLRAGPARYATSMTVPAGDVISYSPNHGSLLPGQSVVLTISQGKPTVDVPSLGRSETASFAAAKAALTAIHLGATEVDQYSDTVPKGQVVGTAPGPGAKVDVGSVVTVTISKGPHLVLVPAVSGSVSAAAQSLTDAGFTISEVAGSPLASVVETVPAAGTEVYYGSAIEIVTG
jgi:serine/threonine-protein kinase